jgi:nifR3 family TIM-barrel protein
MPRGFWTQLPRPFTALAPMSGITDAAFRALIARHGKPDVMFTEFVPADGLCSSGLPNLLPLLRYSEAERPIVAQLHGGNPANFRQAARLIAELGFDGLDLNFGCPSRAVEGHGGGAVLIQDPPLAHAIIEAAMDGAGSLPVSVKTRLGYRTPELNTWIAGLLAARPAALTLHARTRNQGYGGRARWEAVAEAAAMAQALYPDAAARPLLIGNGDVAGLPQAQARAAESGCDGVMIGRGAWGNPWCFTDAAPAPERELCEILPLIREHTQLYLALMPSAGAQPLEPMRKHYKAYLRYRRSVGELRGRLLVARTPGNVAEALARAEAALAEGA